MPEFVLLLVELSVLRVVVDIQNGGEAFGSIIVGQVISLVGSVDNSRQVLGLLKLLGQYEVGNAVVLVVFRSGHEVVKLFEPTPTHPNLASACQRLLFLHLLLRSEWLTLHSVVLWLNLSRSSVPKTPILVFALALLARVHLLGTRRLRREIW